MSLVTGKAFIAFVGNENVEYGGRTCSNKANRYHNQNNIILMIKILLCRRLRSAIKVTIPNSIAIIFFN